MTSAMILVLSVEGRGHEGLKRTVSELQAAGADTFDGKKAVYYVGLGAPPVLRGGWEVVRARRLPRGTTEDTMRALTYARFDREDVDRLLFFEDDVQPCQNAVARMARMPIPGRVAFVSCCDLRGLGGLAPALLEVPRDGIDGRGHWGNQALIIPWGTLARVVSKWEGTVPGTLPRMASDVVLAELACEPGERFGVYAPSLVQHVGDVSLATPGAGLVAEGRVARNFRADYDAMSRGDLFQVGRTVAR